MFGYEIQMSGPLFNDNRIRDYVVKFARRTLTEAAIVVQGYVTRRLDEPSGWGDDHNYTGTLRRSIHYWVNNAADVAIVSAGQEASAYAYVVEMGRRPGQRQPPSAPLALWARRKLGVDDREANSIGFLIARKIGREGITGLHMFSGGLEDARGRLDQIVQRNMAMLAQALGS